MGSVSPFWCHICACKFMPAYIYHGLWSSVRRIGFFKKVPFFLQTLCFFPSLMRCESTYQYFSSMLRFWTGMWACINSKKVFLDRWAIVYVDQPSDKFIRVLEIQGYITKNHLLRTCSVYLIFWSKNASCSCKWTCSTKWAGNRPRSIYINILAGLRGFQDKILKFLLSLESQKILGYKEIILKGK